MFEKMESTAMRLREILNELSRPETAEDPQRLQSLMKEQADLTPVVETYES